MLFCTSRTAAQDSPVDKSTRLLSQRSWVQTTDHKPGLKIADQLIVSLGSDVNITFRGNQTIKLYQEFWNKINFQIFQYPSMRASESPFQSFKSKRILSFANLGPVHTNAFSNENAYFFIRFRLPSTLIRSKRFSKTLPRVEVFENGGSAY